MQIVLHARVSGVRICPNKALTRFFRLTCNFAGEPFFQVVGKLYKKRKNRTIFPLFVIPKRLSVS